MSDYDFPKYLRILAEALNGVPGHALPIMLKSAATHIESIQAERDHLAAELERVKLASVLVWVGNVASTSHGVAYHLKRLSGTFIAECYFPSRIEVLGQSPTEAKAACQAHHQARYEQMRGSA